MAKKKSALPWLGIIFVLVVVWALLADYARKNPVVFWAGTIAVVSGCGYALYRFRFIREKIWGAAKDLSLSLTNTNYKEDSPPKTPIPVWIKRLSKHVQVVSAKIPDAMTIRSRVLLYIHGITILTATTPTTTLGIWLFSVRNALSWQTIMP